MSDEEPKDTLSAGLDPLIGQLIQGRYLIEKKLGQGGMGAVYLAEHTLIKKKVAIKCLHAGLASNTDVVRRFHNEAVAATAIGHPNIVDVTDMGRFEDGTFFMALEYLAGRDWQDDLDATGAQALSKVAHIGMQICDALEAASQKGIVHRDLKPENIFLIERHGDPDFVKVLDFGISKFHDGVGGSTKTGELMGTPYYMAPEQVRGDRTVNHVADIYALGVIFFQALSGKVPFDAHTLPELILKIAVSEAPRLDEYVGDIPKPVTELVAAMLSKATHERPQTFELVANALAPYLPETSRLFGMSRSQHPGHFSATSVGGSAEEPSLGHSVPERPRQATPFAARGPDTRGVGTPGEFGRTEPSTYPPPGRAPQQGPSVTMPDSHTDNDALAHITASAARPSSTKRAGMVALLLALTLGASFFWTRGNEPASNPVAPPSTSSQQQTVRVQISTLPPDAELLLDGRPISNPFDGELHRDESSHELIAQREGFETVKRTMVLTAAQRVFIPLTARVQQPPAAEQEAPAAGPQPKRRPTTPPPSARPPDPAPPPIPTMAPAPSPTPAPESAPVPPARPSDLKKIF